MVVMLVRRSSSRVVDIVMEHGPAGGLGLSTAASSPKRKFTIWCSSATHSETLNPDPLDRMVPLIMEEGIVLLGSPIGSREFERITIGKRVEKSTIF